MKRTILMLENDEDDRYITQSVLDENRYQVTLQFATNSDEFWKYLRSVDGAQNHIPSLILLNYYAVPFNAVQILKELRLDRAFRHIPVVILSGSVKPEIVNECYREGANSFIQKPSANVEGKILNFVRYWFETVELA